MKWGQGEDQKEEVMRLYYCQIDLKIKALHMYK